METFPQPARLAVNTSSGIPWYGGVAVPGGLAVGPGDAEALPTSRTTRTIAGTTPSTPATAGRARQLFDPDPTPCCPILFPPHRSRAGPSERGVRGVGGGTERPYLVRWAAATHVP